MKQTENNNIRPGNQPAKAQQSNPSTMLSAASGASKQSPDPQLHRLANDRLRHFAQFR